MSEASAVTAPPSSRWLQLIFGVLCMVMIANLRYGWTLFVGPIDQKLQGIGLAAKLGLE
jgi:MFS transporter, OFA family, oxalate/formate antiporter